MGLPVGSVAVETPGTRVRVVESGNQVSSVTFRAGGKNKGPVYLGDENVSASSGYQLTPGEELHLSMRGSLELSAYYVDAEVGGDIVNFAGISS